VRFEKQSAPKLEDLERMLSRIVKRTRRMLERRGLLEAESADALDAIHAESAQAGMGFWHEPERKKLAAFLEGFSLEAGTHLHENDRLGLEHLCRYGLRPPMAMDRLRRLADGRVLFELRREGHDGVRALAFTHAQRLGPQRSLGSKQLRFLRRLASIVPPPRSHLVRYFGVFAPRSALRATLVPQPAPLEATDEPHQKLPLPPEVRARRLPWADLLKRVFGDDLMSCPCGGRRKVVAFVPGPKAAQEILKALKIEAPLLVIAKARAPPHQESFELPRDDGGIDPVYPD
jgi:hypothetical protein